MQFSCIRGPESGSPLATEELVVLRIPRNWHQLLWPQRLEIKVEFRVKLGPIGPPYAKFGRRLLCPTECAQWEKSCPQCDSIRKRLDEGKQRFSGASESQKNDSQRQRGWKRVNGPRFWRWSNATESDINLSKTIFEKKLGRSSQVPAGVV